jgi:hypothetical protein
MTKRLLRQLLTTLLVAILVATIVALLVTDIWIVMLMCGALGAVWGSSVLLP